MSSELKDWYCARHVQKSEASFGRESCATVSELQKMSTTMVRIMWASDMVREAGQNVKARSGPANEVKPIEIVVVEVEREDKLELGWRKECLNLVEIVPFHPGRTAVGLAPPLGEGQSAIAHPALLRIRELDPAPSDGKMLQ